MNRIPGINTLVLVKDGEQYVFIYDHEHRSDCLRTIGRFASNPELNFSWHDAALLSQRISQTAKEWEASREQDCA